MATETRSSVERELARLIGHGAVVPVAAAYLTDETEGGVGRGRADAVVLPSSADDVSLTLAWCYEHDVPLTARGGGTGYAGGAVPLDGGVVVSHERLTAVRRFHP